MEKNITHTESPGSLRPSQLVTSFGPGSLVQMEKDSVIVMGLDIWNQDYNNYKIINHPFLEALLDKDHFRMPLGVGRNTRIIPCKSFPTWGVCSRVSCSRLQPHKQSPVAGKRVFRCDDCKSELYPARFVIMCDNGHLDEFPWVEWAHSRSKEGICENPKLTFRARGESPGLEDYFVKCVSCGTGRNCRGATSHDGLQDIVSSCTGYCPWLGEITEKCENHGVSLRVYGIQTRATSLYFSSTVSALFIPEWLNPIQKEITKNKDAVKALLAMLSTKEIAERSPIFDLLRSEYTANEISIQLTKRFDVKNTIGSSSTELEIRKKEFDDLINSKFSDDEFLEIDNEKIDASISQYIDHLKKIKRITEVRVLRYFTRGQAPDPYSPEDNVTVHHCRISRKKLDWYPAVENKGEGFLFTLNEKKLREWESRDQVRDRCDAIIDGFEAWAHQRNWELEEKFTSRYILLHTLSHNMIRQLSTIAGYNEASIRERIYRGPDYNGILLYTATPSSDGSLGGLVRQSESRNFVRLLDNTISKAIVCSRDPLCIEDDPIEKREKRVPAHARINGSACYGCTLLPETCCENSNRLLDRKILFDNEIGFFNGIL